VVLQDAGRKASLEGKAAPSSPRQLPQAQPSRKTAPETALNRTGTSTKRDASISLQDPASVSKHVVS